jgi:hypothetical protein
MHTQHAHRQRVGGIKRADAHQRRHDRNTESRCEIRQRFGRFTVHYATSGINERSFCSR